MTQLKEGAVAPMFKGKDQDDKWITLDDFKGKKVVLYFYPKDDTPGCTAEACNLRDNYESLLDRGFAIVGVSPDDEKSHAKFRSKFDLPFSLIADPEARIGYGYVPNRMDRYLTDPRDQALRTALYHSIGDPDPYHEE